MSDIKKSLNSQRFSARGTPASRKVKALEQEISLPILRTIPKNSQGRNGDMAIVIERGKQPSLYFKANNLWYTNFSVQKEVKKRVVGPVNQPNNPTSAAFDTGWFRITDANDTSVLNPHPGNYQITHNLSSDFVTTQVYCRFEGIRNGTNDFYVIDLNSHISNSGPNSNRYGYWINMMDKNTIELNINPDGLSIIHGEILADSSDNTSTLISSSDSTNVGAIELRVFASPLIGKNNRKITMETPKSDGSLTDTYSKNRISTGDSVVNNLGATVDGTKNSSFTIDSDGSGVMLKNDSGVLKVRNAADSADAQIRCAGIKDNNDNEVIAIGATSNATDHVKITNAATGSANYPTVTIDGSDSNKSLAIQAKGTGHVYVTASHADSLFNIAAAGGGGVKWAFDADEERATWYGSGTKAGHIEAQSDGEVQIWNMIDSGTGADISISAVDDLRLGTGNNNIQFFSGGMAPAGASFAMGTQFAEFSSAGGSYLTHTATATSEGLKIDSNLSGDDASNGTGLYIDFDRTVASSGTENHLDSGINLDVNSATLGTGTVRGIDIDVVGATSGTSTAIGLDVDADGADTNIGMVINTTGTHIKLTADADPADDYATLAVADTGDLTIATIGDGARDSDLLLDVDGAVKMDSASGSFHMLNSGTEFSETGSAYAGMILGYTRLQGDLTNTNAFEIQNSMTVEDDTHKITFKTPPSELVEIEATFLINCSSSDTRIEVGLSTANATDGYSAVSAELEYDANGIMFTDDEVDDHVKTIKWVLSASHLASIGSSNTFWIGFSTAGVTKTANLTYGYRASFGLGEHPFVIKATALPSTIYDGQ